MRDCLPRWILFVVLVQGLLVLEAAADAVRVTDRDTLRAALGNVRPGSTIQIAPGSYGHGYELRGVRDVTVEAADAAQPPLFDGGSLAWHFAGCSNLTVRNLRIRGQSGNGINVDDGSRSDPTAKITLEGLDVSDTGPEGNRDGIKCSGLDELTIRNCRVAGWGGQAIDLVGCHRVLVTGCSFAGKPGFSQASGVQCKGGSSDVVIEKCEFQNAGQRPINAGGSTGIPFFRPRDANYEARNVVIRQNKISGSPCAVAFTGVDGATFTENTILFPERWTFRILQESTDDRFVPCRNVKIEKNDIVFRRSQVQVDVNISPKTAPETFVFAKNRWYAEDRPDRSRPRLPTNETDGIYGTDPRSK